MFRLCCLALLVISAINTAHAQAPAIDPDVEKILRERLEHLRYCAISENSLLKTARGSFDRLINANRLVLEAELELAKTPAERIEAREKLLKHAEELEETAVARLEAGLISTSEMRLAKAIKLRAQADLLIEKKAAAK